MPEPDRWPVFEPMTPEEVAEIRRLGGARQLARIDELNQAARAQMAATVREEHPDWDDALVQREVVRRVLRSMQSRPDFHVQLDENGDLPKRPK